MIALVLTVLSVFCAVIPMLGFLVLVWWLDRYDREPLWLFALTFLWGAIGAVGLALVGSEIALLPFALLSPGAAATAGPVVVAPLVEEPAKALFLVVLLASRHFDNVTDGFVYGAAAGLGFGMTENLLYFTTVGATGSVGLWVSTVMVRTLYSALMHATATSVVGASVGLVRFRGFGLLLLSGATGLVLAVGIHVLWNGLLTLEELAPSGGLFAGANFVLFPLELLLILVVFQVCLLLESATIRRELLGEAGEGLIPAEHARIAASWLRRLGTGWVPEGVPRKRYVEALTTLAMRRRQARLVGAGSPFYRDEVQRLRRALLRMQGREP